jgi:hypothetical protein
MGDLGFDRRAFGVDALAGRGQILGFDSDRGRTSSLIRLRPSSARYGA